jgi:hypothetical protein
MRVTPRIQQPAAKLADDSTTFTCFDNLNTFGSDAGSSREPSSRCVKLIKLSADHELSLPEKMAHHVARVGQVLGEEDITVSGRHRLGPA